MCAYCSLIIIWIFCALHLLHLCSCPSAVHWCQASFICLLGNYTEENHFPMGKWLIRWASLLEDAPGQILHWVIQKCQQSREYLLGELERFRKPGNTWPVRNTHPSTQKTSFHSNLLLLSVVLSTRDAWAGPGFDVMSTVPWQPTEWLWSAPAWDVSCRLSGEPPCLRAAVNASCLLQLSTKHCRSSPHHKTAWGDETVFSEGLLPASACFQQRWQEPKHLQRAHCPCPLLPDISV